MIDILKKLWEAAKKTGKWYMFLLAAVITAGCIIFYVLTSCQTTNTVNVNEGGSQSVTVNTDRTSETGSKNNFPINVDREKEQGEQEKALLYQTNAPSGQ